MSGAKTRIGLAGLDHWYAALAFADAAAASDMAELVVLADDDESRAAEVAARYGARLAASPEQLAREEAVDAVLSFVSNDRNPEVCVAAAESGKHIISVKPLARSVDEAAKVAAAVRESGIVFIPGETLFRFTGWYSFVKQWIDAGGLGDPLHAYFWVWCGLPQRWAGSDDPGWFVNPARATGGAWIDHGIYGLDTLRSLWGREPVDGAGYVANLKFPSLAVEDHGVATVQFAGGASAVLESSWDAPPGIPFELGLQLFGTKGAAALDSRTGRVAVLGEDGGWQSGAFDAEGSEARCLEHFLSAIAGDEPPIASVDDAVATLAAGLAFYEAAARRDPVGVA